MYRLFSVYDITMYIWSMITPSKPEWLGITMVPAHHQPTPARNIDNDAIPFSEILLLLEELGTNAELAIEAAVMELSDRRETLHSFNICHGNAYDDTKATQLEITPVYGVLQEEEVVTALVFPNVHVPQSTTCCVANPFVKHS